MNSTNKEGLRNFIVPQFHAVITSDLAMVYGAVPSTGTLFFCGGVEDAYLSNSPRDLIGFSILKGNV